jgi:hypothetical protein
MALVAMVHDQVPYWLHGLPAQATIINKSTGLQRGLKGRTRTSYTVLYEFRDSSGNPHQGRGSIDKQRWEAIQPGDSIPVAYVSGDPRQNRLRVGFGAAAEGFLALAAFLLLGAIMALGGAVWLVHGIRTLVRTVHLIQAGQPAAGIVDRLEPVCGKSGTPRSFDCTYHFLPAPWTGAPSQVQHGTVSLDPSEAKDMQPGDLLLILFNPKQPEQNTVDIYNARTEDPATLLPARHGLP